MAVFIASYSSKHPSRHTVYIIINMHGGVNNIQTYKQTYGMHENLQVSTYPEVTQNDNMQVHKSNYCL